MRTRAALWTPVPHTNRQDHVPESGTKSADQTNRAGVAERVAAPAVPKSVAGALALRDYDDQRLQALAWAMVQTAPQPKAHPLSLLQTGPGIGPLLRRVLVDAIHAIARCPRGHECVSSGRLVTCATASAGQRAGPTGTQRGPASLTWAFAEAAVVCLRHPPPGPQSLAPLEHTHGKGQALTVLAHTLARAVDARCQRAPACPRQPVLQRASGAERRRPPPHGPMTGCAWRACAVLAGALRRARLRAPRPLPLRPTLGLDLRAGSALDGARCVGLTAAAPPPILALTGARMLGSPLLAEDGTRVPRCC
jgi:hypothetical protein